MKPVTVIICTYNEVKFVDECLSNLRKIKDTSYPDLEVIVKNQASTDGSKELIQEKHQWVKLIDGANDGLSKAYNICYRAAQSEYLLFLGMDAFPDTNVIPGLVQYFDEHQDVGAATVRLVLNDGGIDMDAHRAFPTPWISFTRLVGLHKLFPKSSFFNGYFLPDRDLSKPHEIDLCISHFMFVRKSLLDKIGGFDENFFLYGEDVDICYRIKESGMKLMYLPMWSSRHVKGGSIGIRKTSRKLVKKPLKQRLKMQRLSSEAMELFVRKHYMEKYPKPLLYLMIFATRVLGILRVIIETFR